MTGLNVWTSCKWRVKVQSWQFIGCQYCPTCKLMLPDQSLTSPHSRFNNSEKPDTSSSVNTEVTDDKPVFYKYITPQTIAICCFYFWGNLWSSACTEECIGGIFCKLVILECRTMFTNAYRQVFFRIIHSLGIIDWCFHGNFHQNVISQEYDNILPRHHKVSQRLWIFETLPHQADKRKDAIMDYNPVIRN